MFEAFAILVSVKFAVVVFVTLCLFYFDFRINFQLRSCLFQVCSVSSYFCVCAAGTSAVQGDARCSARATAREHTAAAQLPAVPALDRDHEQGRAEGRLAHASFTRSAGGRARPTAYAAHSPAGAERKRARPAS